MRIQRVIIPLLLVLSIIASLPVLAGGKGNPNPGILPVQSNAHGKACGEWSGAWWQWALSFPQAVNPMLDDTGENTLQGQSGSVWFLAGSWTDDVRVRTITVPTGKSLFFPIFNSVWIFTEGDPGWPSWMDENEQMFREAIGAWVESMIADTEHPMKCWIDGVEVLDLPSYRCKTPEDGEYYVTMPADNMFGLPAGTYGPSVDDGIWLMVPPLPVGEHVIHFTAGTFQNITYNITVQAADRKGNPNPGVLPPQSTPFGKTYGNWGAEWWKWALAASLEENPVTDDNGEDAYRNQSGKVFFLAGTFGEGWTPNPVTRTVTVEAGKALFFPVSNWNLTWPDDAAMFGLEPEEFTLDVMKDILDSVFDNTPAEDLACEVDGVALIDLLRYRGQSDAYELTLPPGSIAVTEWAYAPGTYYPNVSDGYWIMLAPLSAGEHQVHIRCWGYDGSGNRFLYLDVTYNLTVQASKTK